MEVIQSQDTHSLGTHCAVIRWLDYNWRDVHADIDDNRAFLSAGTALDRL